MKTYSSYYGVDISKDWFDVMNQIGEHRHYSNDAAGFKVFFKELDKTGLVVMEATGYYHFRLAQFLHSRGIATSVVNPLRIKRFVQMQLLRVKTDRSDARVICAYGQQKEVSAYRGVTAQRVASLQELRLTNAYRSMLNMLQNKLKGEFALGRPSKKVYHSLNRSMKHIKKEIDLIDRCLECGLSEEEQVIFKNLKGIPGIGARTAMSLIIHTDGFTRFATADRLSNHIGLAPCIRMSGKRVRGRNAISKQGNARLRSLLFLCSFTACKYNKACREFYERLVGRGKSKKLALIGVANKLLRQAFAIAKSGEPYREDHISVRKTNTFMLTEINPDPPIAGRERR